MIMVSRKSRDFKIFSSKMEDGIEISHLQSLLVLGWYIIRCDASGGRFVYLLMKDGLRASGLTDNSGYTDPLNVGELV